jgi:hypothetical protein
MDAFETLGKALAAGKTFDEAVGELKFEAPDPFTRMRPPSGVPNARQVLERVVDKTPPVLLDPIETDSGTVLVYLASRTPPGEDKLQEERASIEAQLRRRKEGAALQDFYTQLENASNTRIDERWKGRM